MSGDASTGRFQVESARESQLKVIVLAGGFGTRLSEETTSIPKPMVEIGDRPMIVHIMRHYARFGFNDFIIACGYRGSVIKDYFAGFRLMSSDFTVDLGSGRVETLAETSVDWTVSLVDTGLNTMTGGRIARLIPYVEGTFMATYGDGLSDIDLKALLDFHSGHGKLATVTAVRPEARFGSLSIGHDRAVVGFEEKVSTSEARINGGFFVFEPEISSYIEGDDTPLEGSPLERLAADGELMAFPHDGFWKPMDTLRDKKELDRLWSDGSAPWT